MMMKEEQKLKKKKKKKKLIPHAIVVDAVRALQSNDPLISFKKENNAKGEADKSVDCFEALG